ncbi:MFS transporter [Leucobacter rhizosphaerae]|uniref:MFS transporter n=1 Tax=Leucobacter rhizosphaerae TaxID=2932245 RepID=A0ABY4FSK0_9MICO|nr:MFS transporter [Leucobacter rhizosphaerae]UOQ59271.1 MFS transporter [Leucobacter rhizosphaerae]
MRTEDVGSAGLAARRLVIAALACGGFGIGVSEFLVMGLLPQISADLLPALSRADPDAAHAATGGLASAYALGVVVGIITTPILVRRLSERWALIVCAGSMLLGTIATAFAPTLAIAIVLRFLSALTHASYIGVAAMLIAHLLVSGKYGRGSAIVHGGLTGANLLGVPVLTALGAAGDWRVILGSTAVFFAVPLAALLAVRVPATAVATLEHTSGGIRPRSLLTLIAAAVLATAGGFAIITYVAPVIAVARGGDDWVTGGWAMLAFGVGMNLGNFGSGWIADRRPGAAFAGSAVAGALGAALLLVPGIGGAGAVAAILLVGICLGGGSPPGQVLYMRELLRYPRLASALPSGAGNLGSFVGALAGGAILAGGGVGWIPIGALALVGLGLLSFAAYRVARR